ncbi:uncharacterized protein JN550_002084 [Neoarthrinium moseri]|uniref:uncharacterized protein n=1 Tax=Neoarthrinium moseri TaxID=1658444 RepID=UPI001FDCB75C|nr:uncharacterized protein JN550_002084 [Neoarthrinium moseri]KAI1875798.1 hypothetical protein JN550_002084 [Neoarthrinium moseri]
MHALLLATVICLGLVAGKPYSASSVAVPQYTNKVPIYSNTTYTLSSSSNVQPTNDKPSTTTSSYTRQPNNTSSYPIVPTYTSAPTPTPPTNATLRNLFYNPGFEDNGGSLSPWNVSTDGNATVRITRPGSNSANAAVISGDDNNQTTSDFFFTMGKMSQTFDTLPHDPLNPTRSYDFSYEYKYFAKGNCQLQSHIRTEASGIELYYTIQVIERSYDSGPGYVTFSERFTTSFNLRGFELFVGCIGGSFRLELDNFSALAL